MAHRICKALATKRLHNFPAHLICVPTLPVNTLATEITLFSADRRMWL